MIKTKPKPPNDLWERLDSELQKLAPVVPPDSFSFKEFRERYNLTDSMAADRLNKLIKAGWVKRVCTGHYMLSKGEKDE